MKLDEIPLICEVFNVLDYPKLGITVKCSSLCADVLSCAAASADCRTVRNHQ